MNFSLNHIASLCKYTGISFTAGAVTHGFFSEERAAWTVAIGVVLYLIGGILDKLANPDQNASWTGVLAIGILASVGLGLFTGGLQHFPDSPYRSVWVVPVGFVMSLLAGYLMEGRGKAAPRDLLRYGLIGTAIVVVASLVAFEVLHDDHSPGGHGDHKH